MIVRRGTAVLGVTAALTACSSTRTSAPGDTSFTGTWSGNSTSQTPCGGTVSLTARTMMLTLSASSVTGSFVCKSPKGFDVTFSGSVNGNTVTLPAPEQLHGRWARKCRCDAHGRSGHDPRPWPVGTGCACCSQPCPQNDTSQPLSGMG